MAQSPALPSGLQRATVPPFQQAVSWQKAQATQVLSARLALGALVCFPPPGASCRVCWVPGTAPKSTVDWGAGNTGIGPLMGLEAVCSRSGSWQGSVSSKGTFPLPAPIGSRHFLVLPASWKPGSSPCHIATWPFFFQRVHLSFSPLLIRTPVTLGQEPLV